MAKSKWPDAEAQLDVTLYAVRTRKEPSALSQRVDQPLSDEKREAIIHRLIKKFDGIQDPALGTVVIPMLDEDGILVQLWIHDWE